MQAARTPTRRFRSVLFRSLSHKAGGCGVCRQRFRETLTCKHSHELSHVSSYFHLTLHFQCLPQLMRAGEEVATILLAVWCPPDAELAHGASMTSEVPPATLRELYAGARLHCAVSHLTPMHSSCLPPAHRNDALASDDDRPRARPTPSLQVLGRCDARALGIAPALRIVFLGSGRLPLHPACHS